MWKQRSLVPKPPPNFIDFTAAWSGLGMEFKPKNGMAGAVEGTLTLPTTSLVSRRSRVWLLHTASDQKREAG